MQKTDNTARIAPDPADTAPIRRAVRRPLALAECRANCHGADVLPQTQPIIITGT